MADEVINSLENMKLTTEEEEVIAILDEGRKEEIESCSLSLIGKFLTCKPFNKRAALSTLRRAWGLDEGVQMVEVGSNLFQFKFKTEFEMERIIKSGPWSFDNQVLMVKRWKQGMTAGNVQFDSVALWVQIWGAPFDMASSTVAAKIGSRLGRVEEVEKRQKLETQNMFMRVKVAIPISKPIRRGGFIAGTDGQRTWVTFRYERLPMFCHWCGLMGHDLKHCALHFAALKNGGSVTCQYGEWLKSTGGRPRSPSRKDTTHKNTTQGNEEADQRRNNTSEGREAAEDDNRGSINPRDSDNSEKGKSMESGSSSDFTEQSITDMVVTELENSNSNGSAITRTENAEHVDIKKNSGPHFAKPRPTWTKIARMDHGPGDLVTEEPVAVLGKRGVYQDVQETEESIEKQSRKRSKSQTSSQCYTTAGVMDHPYREQ
uniref:DUF4283 domain-containing protein n=1 Tax=Quercus lobata TaxID=97700 RepID=A0A7N2MAT8_QUELO